ARFYNEVRVARQVTHPNICRVYDVGVAEGLHYISMEFVDGEDLGSLLRRIGRLPVDKGVETARKLCAGLAAAHDKGVLHRDLKPANVMIDGRGQVIIMDFGLAGLAEQLQGDVRSGTPAYMSPEQLAGTEVTIKSDIYALGLLLYEIFTGRRAFEASSMIELMQMQEKASPLSITSMVRDLDPTVERVILRCLQPDPRQRPGSALTVAAGLPGGDPLAAALAAGETPSPELVAAAGDTEGLEPKVAIAWLATAVVLLGAAIVIGPSQCILSKLNLENSPDALTRDARTILRDFGYTTKPADAVWGLGYDDNYQKYASLHFKEADARWKNPAAGQPPIVKFWYRESPQPLTATRRFNVSVDYNDPPMEQSGMIRLETNPDGKLLALDVVPPQVEKPAPPAAPFDWNRLFQAAGLEMASFQPTEPAWTPLANWDARAAWTGVDTASGAKLRVEATAWRGRPVSFRIVGPWTVPGRMPAPSSGNQMPILVIVYTVIVASGILAWRNMKGGKGDMRSAFRLAAIYFLCMAAASMFAMHHTATLGEISLFWLAVSGALLNALLCWGLYVALEPWVRRRWPTTIISWTRYTSRGPGDPLVGRDLLYGVVLGLVLQLTTFLSVALHGNNRQPLFPPLAPLVGIRMELATLLMAIPAAIFTALLFFFMIFILRVILRKEWIAAAVFVLIITFALTTGTTTPWVDYPLNAVAFAVFGFALLRFGLLAAMVASATGQALAAGAALDFSAWYAGVAFLPILVVSLMAIYGFKTSLGGRPLFKEE
ncbi:MAG: Serine/threonine protein kinase, partial [Candidatus Solibacter sp.]|nr:Serine/threonine protein kinase [Candidatus Solibacter sp.]